LVGAAKIININLRSRLDCTILLGPTKTQNPNMHSQLDYRISVGTRKEINQKLHSRLDYRILVGPTKTAVIKTIIEKSFLAGPSKNCSFRHIRRENEQEK
jgi:hypothetical protein